ncbi:MAG TPA: sulfite exporter TauE/SafE family protein [Burkholderiales bacterium]|nr:sulfite exporter TauE/SafE family protein [Burkholderiales bacterium]
MPFPLETLIAVPLIGLLAYIILGISGFGSALVTIPLLVHFLPLQSVVPLVVTVDFLATVSNGLRFREHVEVSELKLVIPSVIVGILSGVTLLATLPKHAALILLGVFVTGYGIYRLATRPSTKPVSRWWGIPTGLIGGLIGGLFGVGGPIYATYMSARIHDPARMRATLSAVFSFSTGLRLVVYLLSGLLLQPEIWWAFLLLVPAMPIGLAIGHRLHTKLTRDQVGRFISVLLVVSGVSLLWKAL